MSNKNSLPFGLRFEEHPTSYDFKIPVYDEEENISIVIDKNGNKVPAVEFYGNLNTQTVTKAQEENSLDEDPNSFPINRTQTFTEVKEESTDSDPDMLSSILSTRTETFTQSEQSDEDPGIDTWPKPLTTKTATSVAKEETDSDEGE